MLVTECEFSFSLVVAPHALAQIASVFTTVPSAVGVRRRAGQRHLALCPLTTAPQEELHATPNRLHLCAVPREALHRQPKPVV